MALLKAECPFQPPPFDAGRMGETTGTDLLHPRCLEQLS
jgi:hypothetical protein